MSVLEFTSSTVGEEPASIRILLPNSASEFKRTSSNSLANMPLLVSVQPDKWFTEELDLQAVALKLK